MTKKQHYMKYDERCKLEAWLRAGRKAPWIAKQLGFCKQTIYNEIKRGEVNCVRNSHGIPVDTIEYSADKAQQIHNYNQTVKGRPIKLGKDIAYANYLEQKMLGVQKNGKIDRRKRYSPAAALAEAEQEGFQTKVCVSTLYSYIDKRVFLHLTNKDLIVKGIRKQRKNKVKRIAHPQLPSITERPEHINQQKEPGHKEIDLIIGKAGTKAALLTMIDRNTGLPMSIKIPDKSAASVRAVFDQLERKLGKEQFQAEFKTITTDNGGEFLEYDALCQSIYGGKRFEVYYCHSYAAWEKGQNENFNRMMRRFFPKGTDFTNCSGQAFL